HGDIGAVAIGGLDRVAAQRQLADIELGLAEGAEEDFLRLQHHEDRVDPVDLHRAVEERPHAVVIADGDRKFELAHCAMLRWPTSRLIASTTASGLALPVPAISSALPWATEENRIGVPMVRPAVRFWASSLAAIWPWSWIITMKAS